MAVTLDNQAQAAKFLYRATFGPKGSDVADLLETGVDNWLEQQFNIPPQLHLNLAREYAKVNNTVTNKQSRRGAWWYRTLYAEDQLRQRVAYALSEIFVLSTFNGGPRDDEALIAYYDLLLNHAFGNFRQLLEQVTLSPAMGKFLSLNKSKKANPKKNSYPDENYAREVMQLFTIGLWELDSDGQSVLDSDGKPKPTYSQQDVEEMARVLTGWTSSNAIDPMHSVSHNHDMGQKKVLHAIFPEGQSPEQDLSQAMDLLFNHPNTPTYFSTLLIKRLTTSNPHRAYIKRVSDVFRDNGYGVRGDLKAVIKAVLLDSDVLEGKAMSDYQNTGNSSNNFGKVKEPVVAMTNLARALEVTSNRPHCWSDFPGLGNNNFGQAPLEAPSVFNFYEAEYSPKGEIFDKKLVAPEFNILNMCTLRAISNRMWAVIEGTGHRRGWNWDRSEFKRAIDNPDRYLDLLNLRFFGGNMPSDLSNFLKNMLLENRQNGQSADQQINDTLFAIQCSPEFRCQY